MSVGPSANHSAPARLGWYVPTPGKFLLAVMLLQIILFLSTKYRWFPFNEHKGYTVLVTVAATAVALSLLLVWLFVGRLFRWKPQFSLTTLLFAILIAAIPCGCLVQEIELAKRQKAVIVKLKDRKTIRWDWAYRSRPRPTASLGSRALAWCRFQLGDDFFYEYTDLRVYDAIDSDLLLIAQLPRVTNLTIDHGQIAGDGLSHLQEMHDLRKLSFSRTAVDDAGLEQLKGLTKLQRLELDGTRVTDAGMAHLSELTQLEALSLTQTKVTDAGLEHLLKLKYLVWLDVDDDYITPQGVQQVRAALPRCQVVRRWK